MLWVKKTCQFWHKKGGYYAKLTGQPIDDLKTAVVNKIEKGKIKKEKKSRKHGFLKDFLENGMVGGGKKGDFIGLIGF
jgi:hypothetical protein